MNVGDWVICKNSAFHCFSVGKPYQILDISLDLITLRDDDGDALEWSDKQFTHVTDLSELEKVIYGII